MSIEDLAIQNSRKHLIDYCITYDKNYIVNWHHRKIAEALEKVERGEINRLIIEMPPRHGKSQLASIYFPSWFLGRNPDKEIIIASYSGDLAKDFGGKTRDVVSDAQYQSIFDTRLKQDSKSKDKWQTNKGGSYTSVGRGGATTGRGANIFLIDDPIKNREEAESEVIREKCWNWYTSVVNTRLEGMGAVIIIMTRWHLDDLVGRVKEKALETGEKWDVISFPAIAVEDEEFRKEGEALWSFKKTLKELEGLRVLDLYDFECLWQQNPISAATQEFKKEYFKKFEEEDLPDQFDIDITIDPAISKSKKACNTAILGVAKQEYSPNWHILDYVKGKLDPYELIEATFKMYYEFRGKYPNADIKVWIEGVAYQEALKYVFEEEMKRQKKYLNIETFIDKHDKDQRIKGLVPQYKMGLIYHRSWMTDIENELIQFPRGKYKDLIDALSFHLHISPPTEIFDPASLIEAEENNNRNMGRFK